MTCHLLFRIAVPVVCLTLSITGCSSESTELTNTPDPNVEVIENKSAEATTESTGPTAKLDFYTVSHYDEKRDPTSDLVTTIERAKAENKRILIQVGGEWCGWCHRISKYIETNEVVRGLTTEHFLVMKVTYPSEYAESFLENYPKIDGYPHFFVLEQDGTLLHSQGTAELEQGKSYNQSVFSDFLTSWIL